MSAREKEDMEEGEVLEEGEISDEETAPVTQTNRTEEASVEKPKKDSGSNSFEAFMRKKREELQQKVKSQLELAGVKANVVEGAETEADCVLPDSLESSKSKKRGSDNRGGPKGPRYRDLDPRTSASASDPTETMINSWLSGKKKVKGADSASSTETAGFDPNEEYYGPDPGVQSAGDKDYRGERLGDKDYRWGRPGYGSEDEDLRESYPNSVAERDSKSNEFGDRDYRLAERSERDRGTNNRPSRSDRDKRRRRHSGSEEEGEEEEPETKRTRRKRRRPSPSPPRRRQTRWDRPTICRYFRDGFCRDGESCSFSHSAADSLRKPELCKYYQQGYCKKSMSCPFLHGEYPCKAFHKGECSKGDDCPYSHANLDSFTQPIFDQMLRDEELAAKITIPAVPTKRKTLLPIPGSVPTPGLLAHPRPLMENNSFVEPTSLPPQMPMMANGSGMMGPGNPMMLAASAPTLDFSNPVFLPQEPAFPVVDSQNLPVVSSNPVGIPVGQSEPQPPLISEPSNGATASFNINEMLRKIKAQVKGEDEEIPEESPASPPMQQSAPTEAIPQQIPFNGTPQYRLFPVDVQKPAVDPALLQASLSDPKLRNDPRIKKLLDNQFNAVSSMIVKSGSEKASGTAVDPRSAARDPRLQKQQPPPSGEDPTASDAKMDEMIKLQLQQIIQQQQAQVQGGGPMGMMPPASGMEMDLGMMGTGPAGFPLPQVAPAGWMPQFGMNGPGLDMGPINGPPMFDMDSEERGRASRWNSNFNNFPSPSQSDPVLGAVNEKPLSMREKRKDLQYDSPLAIGLATRNSSDSRYNEIPNVKVRKLKSSPNAFE